MVKKDHLDKNSDSKKTKKDETPPKKSKKDLKEEVEEKAPPKKSKKEVEEKVVPKKSKKDLKEEVEEKVVPKKSKKDLKEEVEEKVVPKKSKKTVNENNNILEIKTIQTAAFKQAIERISGSISECCFVFFPQNENDENDEDYFEEIDNKNTSKKSKTKNVPVDKKAKTQGGIRLTKMSEDKSMIVKLTLYAAKFEYFRCTEPKIVIGVDMHAFNDNLKMINDSDILKLFITSDNRGVLNISSISENESSIGETDLQLNLMEIPNSELPLPPTEFQNKIKITSDRLHTICKGLSGKSTTVEIISTGNQISFGASNESGVANIKCKDNEYNGKAEATDIVQGVFELRHLEKFSKCNKMCDDVDIFLKNNFPLVVIIRVASLGKMYVFLSPIEQSMNN